MPLSLPSPSPSPSPTPSSCSFPSLSFCDSSLQVTIWKTLFMCFKSVSICCAEWCHPRIQQDRKKVGDGLWWKRKWQLVKFRLLGICSVTGPSDRNILHSTYLDGNLFGKRIIVSHSILLCINPQAQGMFYFWSFSLKKRRGMPESINVPILCRRFRVTAV